MPYRIAAVVLPPALVRRRWTRVADAYGAALQLAAGAELEVISPREAHGHELPAGVVARVVLDGAVVDVIQVRQGGRTRGQTREMIPLGLVVVEALRSRRAAQAPGPRTMGDVARAAGVGGEHLSRVIRGRRPLSPALLARLVMVLPEVSSAAR